MYVCLCMCVYLCILPHTNENFHPASNRVLWSFLFKPGKTWLLQSWDHIFRVLHILLFSKVIKIITESKGVFFEITLMSWSINLVNWNALYIFLICTMFLRAILLFLHVHWSSDTLMRNTPCIMILTPQSCVFKEFCTFFKKTNQKMFMKSVSSSGIMCVVRKSNTVRSL